MNDPEAEPTVEKYEVVLPKEQRRALLYRTLSLLWIFPSLGALWIIAPALKNWKTAPTFGDSVRLIRLEEWLALLLLAAHVGFVFLAWRNRKKMSLLRIDGQRIGRIIQ